MALWTEPAPGGAYHLTVNLFNGPDLSFRGVRVFAFDRAAMLNGDANPTAIAFTSHSLAWAIPIVLFPRTFEQAIRRLPEG